MRMGKLGNEERHLRKKDLEKTFPKYSSAGLNVGRISSNLYSSHYTPLFLQTAGQILQDYAGDLLDYQDLVREIEAENASQEEVEADGSIKETREVPEPPQPPLFQSQRIVNELSDMLTDTSKFFSAPKSEWKIHAKAARFERRLDEKYGRLRPFITNHPEVELWIRSVQRKYAMGYFSPFRQGDPPIPRTTAVVILFMMQRGKVRWEVMVLASLFFLVGLQPWALVTIVALLTNEFNRRKQKLLGGVDPHTEPVKPYYAASLDGKQDNNLDEASRKQQHLLRPVGTKLGKDEQLDMSLFNTMILGSGPNALYTASLLSRAGRTVLVLSPEEDASGCLTLQQCKKDNKYQSVPFDVAGANVARITQQQEILAPALCTSADLQGGIRFAQIGTAADGYAFDILSIPGMGAEGATEEIPFVLRAAGGVNGLMDEAAACLGDGWPAPDSSVGNSLSGAYLQACASMNASAGEYFLAKVLPEKINDFRNKTTYQESSIRYASSFLDKCFPLNAHLRSLMAGIGMKSENIRPSSTSMGAHVSNICGAMSGEGMHYPIGGPRALCHALASSVEQFGGKIITGVTVKELLFQDKVDNQRAAEAESKKSTAPRCIGAKLVDGRSLCFTDAQLLDEKVEPVIISMHGFIHTFIRIMPEAIRTANKVPRGLPALTEQRPVFHALFALKGSAEDLNVTGADYYRLPGAALAVDERDEETGAVTLGKVGWSTEAEDSTEAEETAKADDTETIERAAKSKKLRKVKFDEESAWVKISFPSAKDPTFSSRHGENITTCIVTVEADDDFAMHFDTKPKLFAIPKETAGGHDQRQRLLDRVTNILLQAFPQLDGAIDHKELRGPFYKGLSHNPERYAAKGIRSDTPFPGLFMGGPDLTIGDSFSASIVSGWLAANAVVGYSALDHLFLKKNITYDLERYMVLPELECEDVAVPYEPPPPPPVEQAEEEDTEEQQSDEPGAS